MNVEQPVSSYPRNQEENSNGLSNLTEISIDLSMPTEQRIIQNLERVQDLYSFQCGETTVRVCFSSGGRDLGQILKSYFLSCKRW